MPILLPTAASETAPQWWFAAHRLYLDDERIAPNPDPEQSGQENNLQLLLARSTRVPGQKAVAAPFATPRQESGPLQDPDDAKVLDSEPNPGTSGERRPSRKSRAAIDPVPSTSKVSPEFQGLFGRRRGPGLDDSKHKKQSSTSKKSILDKYPIGTASPPGTIRAVAEMLRKSLTASQDQAASAEGAETKAAAPEKTDADPPASFTVRRVTRSLSAATARTKSLELPSTNGASAPGPSTSTRVRRGSLTRNENDFKIWPIWTTEMRKKGRELTGECSTSKRPKIEVEAEAEAEVEAEAEDEVDVEEVHERGAESARKPGDSEASS